MERRPSLTPVLGDGEQVLYRTSLLIRKSVFSLITTESVILKGTLKNIIPENVGSHYQT